MIIKGCICDRKGGGGGKIYSNMFLNFLVAKLHYKYKCPSESLFVRMLATFRGKCDFLVLKLRWRNDFFCTDSSHLALSVGRVTKDINV